MNPDMIHLAIEAAGGRAALAQKMGLCRGTINQWALRGAIPAKHIKAVCDFGSHVITVEQVVGYIAGKGGKKNG